MGEGGRGKGRGGADYICVCRFVDTPLILVADKIYIEIRN